MTSMTTAIATTTAIVGGKTTTIVATTRTTMDASHDGDDAVIVANVDDADGDDDDDHDDDDDDDNDDDDYDVDGGGGGGGGMGGRGRRCSRSPLPRRRRKRGFRRERGHRCANAPSSEILVAFAATTTGAMQQKSMVHLWQICHTLSNVEVVAKLPQFQSLVEICGIFATWKKKKRLR